MTSSDETPIEGEPTHRGIDPDLTTTDGADTTDEYRALEGPRIPRDPLPREVQKQARANAIKRVGLVLAGLAIVALVVGQGFAIYLIRDTQVKNKSVIKGTNDAASVIAGCTTPGQACYEQSQRQLVAAVTGVNTVTIRATSCLVQLINDTPSDVTLTADQIAQKIKTCVVNGSVNSDGAGLGDGSITGQGEPEGSSSGGSTPSASPTKRPSSPQPTTQPTSQPTSAPSSPPSSGPTTAPSPGFPAPLIPLLPGNPTPVLCLLGLCVI